MTDCIFCRIISTEVPASVVFEDEDVVAIEPLDTVSKGHTLLIPKRHIENMLDADSSILSHLIVTARDIGQSLLKKHGASGLNLLHAAGKDAQQSVFHLHFHIVPRYEDDGLDLWFRNKL